MNRLVGAALLTIGASAHAVCLNPFGCAPSNYEECVDDATKRPTDTGVKMARAQCYEKFKKPEEERKAREAQETAERLAANWKMVGETLRTAREIHRAIGKPAAEIGPTKCTALAGGMTPPKGMLCYAQSWPDTRSGRMCPTFVKSGSECQFQLEVLADESNTLWAWWPDSM